MNDPASNAPIEVQKPLMGGNASGSLILDRPEGSSAETITVLSVDFLRVFYMLTRLRDRILWNSGPHFLVFPVAGTLAFIFVFSFQAYVYCVCANRADPDIHSWM